MKLTEMKNEQALDALCLLIDPLEEICTADFWQIMKSGKMGRVVKHLLTNHKAALIKILAVMDCADPDTYTVNAFQVIGKTLALLNDPSMIELFTSAAQSVGVGSSGAASAEESGGMA